MTFLNSCLYKTKCIALPWRDSPSNDQTSCSNLILIPWDCHNHLYGSLRRCMTSYRRGIKMIILWSCLQPPIVWWKEEWKIKWRAMKHLSHLRKESSQHKDIPKMSYHRPLVLARKGHFREWLASKQFSNGQPIQLLNLDEECCLVDQNMLMLQCNA